MARQGPFPSMEYANGFIHGLDFMAQFMGQVDNPPQVVRESYSDDGDNWYVDVENV